MSKFCVISPVLIMAGLIALKVFIENHFGDPNIKQNRMSTCTGPK